MMFKKFKIQNSKFVTLLLITILLGCAKKQMVAPPTTGPEEAYKKAMVYYEEKKYDKAIDALQKFIFNFPGSVYAADAQFYLAESQYAKRNYSQAMLEYDFLLRNFTTQRQEEVEYKLALSHYRTAPPYYKDQAPTVQAQERLEAFIAKYPKSQFLAEAEKALRATKEKLAQKEYEAARLYLRYDELNSALVYINYLLTTYPAADYTAQAQFLLAQYYERKKEIAKAVELYEALVKTDSSIKVKAQERLAKLKE